MCICIWYYIYTYKCMHDHVHMYACIFILMHTCVNISMHLCTCISCHTYVIHICVLKLLHIHAHMYIRILFTHISIYIHVNMSNVSLCVPYLPPPMPHKVMLYYWVSQPPRYIIHRVIGNDLPPLQSPGQLYYNVKYIVENEPQFEGECSAY